MKTFNFGSGVDCAVSYASATADAGQVAAMTISAGSNVTSPN